MEYKLHTRYVCCTEIDELMLMVSSKQSGSFNSSSGERMIRGYSFLEQTRPEHLLRRLESLPIPLRGPGSSSGSGASSISPATAIDYHAASRTLFWIDSDEVTERVQSIAPLLPNATIYEVLSHRHAARSGFTSVRLQRSILRRTALDGTSPVFDVGIYCTQFILRSASTSTSVSLE